MTEKMKTTAPLSSVDADGAQPQLKNHSEIIANETAQINLQAAQNPEKSGNGGLQTVSMTELYDTAENADCGRFSLWRHLSLCGCAESWKIVLYGAACLSCGNGASSVGLSHPKGDGIVSGTGR